MVQYPLIKQGKKETGESPVRVRRRKMCFFFQQNNRNYSESHWLLNKITEKTKDYKALSRKTLPYRQQLNRETGFCRLVK